VVVQLPRCQAENFANGAILGAFSYAFNDALHPNGATCPTGAVAKSRVRTRSIFIG